MVKFKESITNYKYILAFDLAKNLSGYSLIDFVNNKIVNLGVIDTTKSTCECLWFEYGNKIKQAIEECLSCIDIEDRSKVLITKEKLPNQSGRFSSIETLQSLAQCHAIFDAVVYNSGVAYYDFDGVHAVSVKAYFKHITGLEKPSKTDIQASVADFFHYDFSGYTLDVTDSIAVALTLLNNKYNKDITERVKELKKQLKAYKSINKINEVKAEIQRLTQILI